MLHKNGTLMITLLSQFEFYITCQTSTCTCTCLLAVGLLGGSLFNSSDYDVVGKIKRCCRHFPLY